MKKGSALVFAIWVIAVLSAMVLSFVYEARQQSGINLYVLSRNRVKRFVNAGKILGEIVMLGYKDAPDFSESEVEEDLLDEDRWVFQKRDLKESGKCTIGPIVLDKDHPEYGYVQVELSTANSEGAGYININNMYKDGGDSRYMERFWMIFRAHNIPEELDTPKDGNIKLWNILIASWDDWRDTDDSVTQIDSEDAGAENDWYKELEDKFEGTDEEKNELIRRPRNGPIPDLKELRFIRGFRDYPQILTGGVINPWAKKDEQITVKGLLEGTDGVFTLTGDTKINVNTCKNIAALVSIPGVYEDPDEDGSLDDAREKAQAIIDGLGYLDKVTRDYDTRKTTLPYESFDDVTTRIGDIVDIGNDASKYMAFKPDDNTVFEMKITGVSGGMSHEAVAKCYVKDKKVRYISWQEN